MGGPILAKKVELLTNKTKSLDSVQKVLDSIIQTKANISDTLNVHIANPDTNFVIRAITQEINKKSWFLENAALISSIIALIGMGFTIYFSRRNLRISMDNIQREIATKREDFETEKRNSKASYDRLFSQLKIWTGRNVLMLNDFIGLFHQIGNNLKDFNWSIRFDTFIIDFDTILAFNDEKLYNLFVETKKEYSIEGNISVNGVSQKLTHNNRTDFFEYISLIKTLKKDIEFYNNLSNELYKQFSDSESRTQQYFIELLNAEKIFVDRMDSINESETKNAQFIEFYSKFVLPFKISGDKFNKAFDESKEEENKKKEKGEITKENRQYHLVSQFIQDRLDFLNAANLNEKAVNNIFELVKKVKLELFTYEKTREHFGNDFLIRSENLKMKTSYLIDCFARLDKAESKKFLEYPDYK